MPPDPCERYSAHVKTAGGLTPEDPTGIIASSFDYREWLTLEERFFNIFETNLKRLQDANPQAAMGFGERTQELVDEREDLLPWWLFVPMTGGQTIQRAVDLTIAWSCELQELEDVMVDQGLEPVIPFKAHAPPETLGEQIGEAVETVGGGLFILAALAIIFGGRGR